MYPQMLTSSGQHSVTHSESVTGQYTVPSTQNNPSLSGHLCSSAPSHSSSVTLGQTAGHRHCIHTRLEVTCGKESTECSSRAGKRPRQPHPVQVPPPQELQQPKEQILLPSVTELQSSLGLEGTSRPHPCPGLGAPPWPGAPPGMGHPQLWAAVQCLTALCVKNFPLTSDPSSPFFRFKAVPPLPITVREGFGAEQPTTLTDALPLGDPAVLGAHHGDDPAGERAVRGPTPPAATARPIPAPHPSKEELVQS